MIVAGGYLIIVTLVAGLVLGGMLTLMRGRPINSLLGFRRLHDGIEVTTRFHSYGYLVLGLLAIGDAIEVYEGLGNPWLIGALLGALAGIAGERHAELVFLPLGIVAVLTSLVSMFSGPADRVVVAAALLIPLAAGIGVGLLPPMLEWRPTVLLNKACAAVILVSFALAPVGIELIGAEIDAVRVTATVIAIAIASVLFAFPGPGVTQLLGIGVGLFGLFYGRLVVGTAGAFTAAFVLLWIGVGLLRRRVRT